MPEPDGPVQPLSFSHVEAMKKICEETRCICSCHADPSVYICNACIVVECDVIRKAKAEGL